MDTMNTTTSNPQDAIIVKAPLRERVTNAVKGIKLGAKTTIAIGGCLIAGGAYWFYRQTHPTPNFEAQE